MASTGKKWGIGCGIGCGVVLLLLGGIGTCGYVGVKKITERAEQMEANFDRMDAEFGKPEDFVPRPDGRIPAGRMEIFLAVRDDLAATRAEAHRMLATLDDEAPGGSGNVLDKIKAGVSFIPALLGLAGERNEALLERGMGLGEYMYIYSLAYYVDLGKQPSDGPSFQLSGPDDEDHQSGPVRWNMHGDGGDEGDVRASRERDIRDLLNQTLGTMARNQLHELDVLLEAGADPGLQAWRDQLAAEVDAMQRERRRILWEEGLPEPLASSIAPYRDRLEASYDELLNSVEIGLVDHE